MHKVYLSLGSNIGDPVSYLDKAVDILENTRDIHKVKVSSYYQTDPVGYLDQDVFVNIAVYLETDLSPYELLEVCQGIEQALNRVRIIRWGPRTIDVDIILFDDVKMTEEKLTIPHPRMHERAFVLVPMFELDDKLMIQDKSIEGLMASVDTSGVRKL